MSDPFATYGDTKAPAIPDNRANRREKDPSKLELKMEERQRLSNAYKAMRRADRIALLEAEPRLKAFMRFLMKVGPDDGDELLEAVRDSWLPTAARNVRAFALERIDRRSDKIKLALGLVPFDDPLPPSTSVFFRAKAILETEGRL